MGWILSVLIAAILLLVIFLINFYRDPERKVPKDNNIVSPADGKIISIIDTSNKELKISKGLFGKIKTISSDISKECYAISIFMSPLDVHINRAPIEGQVMSIKHEKGKFFRAFDLEKSLENEKNEIVIENKDIKIKMIQIAGFLARRIKCYVKKNQKLNKGQRVGMITLGSQVTLVVPKGVELKVKMGQRVKAGETIIAMIK